MSNRCDICINKRYLRDDSLKCELSRNKGKPRFHMPKGPNDVDYGWKANCSDFDLENGSEIMQLKTAITHSVQLIESGKIESAKFKLKEHGLCRRVA